ncbi:hypothetical protein [Peptoniphilus sp. BV3C26]|nr:hypothetical protein [Peptoniphilus sp. BV3C26]
MFQKTFIEDTRDATAQLTIYQEMVRSKMFGLKNGLMIIQVLKAKG